MSYKERLSHLDRDGARSLTEQIVEAFSGSIAGGELEPGDRLPPTRAVAEIARNAPYTTPVRRLDEARASRRPVVRQPLGER